MIRAVEQLPLAERIPALIEMVCSARAQKENYTTQEASYLDMLARAEAEVTGGAPGSEGVALSGLIGANPYAPGAAPPPPVSEDAAAPPTAHPFAAPGAPIAPQDAEQLPQSKKKHAP